MNFWKDPYIYGWLILLLLALIWGSSFILMKKALLAFSPIQVASLRICLSSILFLPFTLVQLKKIDRSSIPYLVVVALSGSGLPAFLFAFAQTEISSSLAGIINALTPLFTFLVGMLFFRKVFQWNAFFGVVIGLIGAGLLVIMSGQSAVEGNVWYALLALMAAICYGVSVNTVHAKLDHLKPFTINAITFGMLGPVTIVLLMSTDFLSVMKANPIAWESLGYVAILSWVGTFTAVLIFFYLVQRTNALFSSSVAYLIPLVAIFWGWLDGEVLSWFHVLGLILIISGVYAIRNSRKMD